MRTLVLANPTARSGTSAGVEDAVAEQLRAHGHDAEILRPASAADAAARLREALSTSAPGSPVHSVVAVGGDGTLRVAVSVLAGSGIPLGVIPVGTGNDFAAAVGLHALDVEQAVDVVLAGRTRTVDLARVTRADGTSEPFATVLASGFDSKVNDRANAMRWPRGDVRYTIAIAIEFLLCRRIPFRLDLELENGDHEIIDGELMMAAIGNGRTYGGGIPICPDARLDDGLLDVTIVRPAGRVRLARVVRLVYRGAHAKAPEVSTYRARRIRIDSPGLTAYADGDPIGAMPLTVDLMPQSLVVLTAV